MATQPKPKPKPEPEPKPDDDDAAAVDPFDGNPGGTAPEGVSLIERVENLEHRMDAVEERQNAPPIGLGKRP